ncbi:hypothetical protein Zmor_013462 [Zophobas morio]|uniref:Endonuclease-reverse transcriptase n=1 Tax=Zophobas morio TaxID=2755281 RepID=A0AA38MFN3_9CUCU|nr:hypothetical protein Zmor_013462 [Zophobas morio]
MRGAEIDSDHFLLVGKIKQHNKDENEGKHDHRTEQQETLKAYRLQEQEVAEKYEEAINKEIQKRQDNMKSMSTEQMWQELKRIMTTAVRDVCGVSKMNRKNRRTAWWSEEIQNQIKMKKKRWKEYLTKRTEEKYNKYKQQRNIVKNMVKEAKNKAWQEFGEKLETNSKTNQKLFYKVLKTPRKGKTARAETIKGVDGNIITKTEEVMERWRQYFQELLGAKANKRNTDKVEERGIDELREDQEEESITLHRKVDGS